MKHVSRDGDLSLYAVVSSMIVRTIVSLRCMLQA